jgi:hypothetical protein
MATERTRASRAITMVRNKKARTKATATKRVIVRKRGRAWVARAMVTAKKRALVQWQRRWQ